MFLDLFISTDAVHVSGGRSTKLYIQLQVLTTNTATIVDEMKLRSISSTISASSSIDWQYLKLYVQLCAPDDGLRNCLKHVERV